MFSGHASPGFYVIFSAPPRTAEGGGETQKARRLLGVSRGHKMIQAQNKRQFSQAQLQGGKLSRCVFPFAFVLPFPGYSHQLTQSSEKHKEANPEAFSSPSSLTPAQSSVVGFPVLTQVALTQAPLSLPVPFPYPAWVAAGVSPPALLLCSQRPQPFTYNTNLTHRFSDETNRSGLTHADRLNHTLLNLVLSQDYVVSSQTGSP